MGEPGLFFREPRQKQMHRSKQMPLLVVLVAFLHAACNAASTDAREEVCVDEHVRKQLVQTRKSLVVETDEKEEVAADDVDDVDDEKKKKKKKKKKKRKKEKKKKKKKKKS